MIWWKPSIKDNQPLEKTENFEEDLSTMKDIEGSLKRMITHRVSGIATSSRISAYLRIPERITTLNSNTSITHTIY